MKRVKFLLLLAVALVLVASWWVFKAKPETTKANAANNVPSTVPAVSTAIEEKPINKKPKASTDYVDAATVHFRQGQFYLDESIRFYFEYFILQRGNLTDEQLQAQLERDAVRRYEKKTAEYLSELFGRYLQYLNAQAQHQTDEPLSYGEIKRIQQRMQGQLFNEQEQKALFSDEYLKKYSNENSLQGKYDKYQKLAEGIDDAQALDALRTESFGLEAAARLKALDQKRAQWQQRLQQYYCAKQQIVQSNGIVEEDKQSQIDALQQRMFQGPEITRVRALDGQNALNVDEKGC